MADAWYSLILTTAGDPETLAGFKADTGHDLRAVLNAGGIAKMIDEATGRDRAVIVAWCDWITKHIWGTVQDAEAEETDES